SFAATPPRNFLGVRARGTLTFARRSAKRWHFACAERRRPGGDSQHVRNRDASCQAVARFQPRLDCDRTERLERRSSFRRSDAPLGSAVKKGRFRTKTSHTEGVFRRRSGGKRSDFAALAARRPVSADWHEPCLQTPGFFR